MIEHDQVEFPAAIVGVGGERVQSGIQQMAARGGLDQRTAGTAVDAGNDRHRRYRLVPNGTAVPPLNVDHAGVRTTLPKPSRRNVPVAPCTLPSARVARRSR